MTGRAVKSKQTSTEDGIIRLDAIHGAEIKQVTNLITANGVTTELHRSDWNLIKENVDHIIHVTINPGTISAWHMHEARGDFIFVTQGTIRMVLYDPRPDSPTYEKVSVTLLNRMHPVVATIPDGVWHGFKNIGPDCASFVNYATRAYSYQNPDEWHLPLDSDDIPYRF